MTPFQKIEATAIRRKGGLNILQDQVPLVKSAADLQRMPEAKWLSIITKSVFNAGFNRHIVERKWNAMTEAFGGFDPHYNVSMDPQKIIALLQDSRLIRNKARIESIQKNAAFIIRETQTHGSFGAMLCQWPSHEFLNLLRYLHKHGDRLGYKTCQYFLRLAGFDGYIISRDVLKRLILEDIVQQFPANRQQQESIDRAFQSWQQQSGQNLTYISKILAYSVSSDSVPKYKL